jgi:hypothetical protein
MEGGGENHSHHIACRYLCITQAESFQHGKLRADLRKAFKVFMRMRSIFLARVSSSGAPR